MSSKQDDNYRRNKKINKGKKFGSSTKKNFLIEDPNDNYNERSYGAFENTNKINSLENNDIVNYEDKKKTVNIMDNDIVNYEDEKKAVNIMDNDNEEIEVFTEDYFEPIVYNNNKK